jgi:hypothetical protein
MRMQPLKSALAFCLPAAFLLGTAATAFAQTVPGVSDTEILIGRARLSKARHTSWAQKR